mmetsp:Transcript_28465/g.58348  ORF Transcript_28465/g.58348 Transcript_28465/m.58348 type:complete len:206 (+) Transcript_28465:91-708(+)
MDAPMLYSMPGFPRPIMPGPPCIVVLGPPCTAMPGPRGGPIAPATCLGPWPANPCGVCGVCGVSGDGASFTLEGVPSSSSAAAADPVLSPGLPPGVFPGVSPGVSPGVPPGVSPCLSPNVSPGLSPGATSSMPPSVSLPLSLFLGNEPGAFAPAMCLLPNVDFFRRLLRVSLVSAVPPEPSLGPVWPRVLGGASEAATGAARRFI